MEARFVRQAIALNALIRVGSTILIPCVVKLDLEIGLEREHTKGSKKKEEGGRKKTEEEKKK